MIKKLLLFLCGIIIMSVNFARNVEILTDEITIDILSTVGIILVIVGFFFMIQLNKVFSTLKRREKENTKNLEILKNQIIRQKKIDERKDILLNKMIEHLSPGQVISLKKENSPSMSKPDLKLL